MKNILQIILISFFAFTVISCAKKSGSSSSSSTATTMSTPSIPDGNYKLTALSVIISNSDGSNYGSGTFQVNHSSSVTPGYLGYGMSWQGSGVYRITVFGKATISNTQLGNETLDCTTNSINDVTLDTNGKMTEKTLIQTGCGGVVLELTIESSTYSAITGGMTLVAVLSNSSYRYQYTYTFLKQDATTSTSYVGAWVKSSNNSIALDWKSDSFIYSCFIGSTYTLAKQGSYSTSNSRVTWWNGSYDTFSASGSNILLGSATYVPATLSSACNPFWTSSTSENTSYTDLAKSMGYWSFVVTISGTTFYDKYLMSAISSQKHSDGTYKTVGTNSDADYVYGAYQPSSGIYTIIDSNPSTYSDVYSFTINSTYTGIGSGCHYFYDKNTSSFLSCSTLTSGTKSYGTPSSYRIISEDDKDKIAIQKQKAMTKLMDLSSKKLTEQDINARKRIQHLLRNYESIDKEPIKRFLQSFRSN